MWPYFVISNAHCSLQKSQREIRAALLDDLDTPRALNIVHDVITRSIAFSDRDASSASIGAAKHVIGRFCDAVGLDYGGKDRRGEQGSAAGVLMDALVGFRQTVRGEALGVKGTQEGKRILRACDEVRDVVAEKVKYQIKDRPDRTSTVEPLPGAEQL